MCNIHRPQLVEICEVTNNVDAALRWISTFA